MTAALGIALVLDLQRIGAGALEQARRAGLIDCGATDPAAVCEADLVIAVPDSGTPAARENRSPKPSNNPKVTNTPTATKASSFTSDSRATAATRPSWRSVASRWRVPKRIVKAAISRAT